VECHVLEDAESEQTQNSIKESEDPESTRDFQDHIREVVGCQEKSE